MLLLFQEQEFHLQEILLNTIIAAELATLDLTGITKLPMVTLEVLVIIREARTLHVATVALETLQAQEARIIADLPRVQVEDLAVFDLPHPLAEALEVVLLEVADLQAEVVDHREVGVLAGIN